MTGQTRRLAAILSADAVGYSRLMSTDEAAALAALRQHRDSSLMPLVLQHGGRIVNSAGDGFLAEFPSVVEAVAAGINVQRAIEAVNAAARTDKVLHFRIGINIGDVVVEGGDLFGDGVNIAARVQGLAGPGEVLVTRAVADQAEGKLPVRFETLGSRHLKNIPTPLEICRARAIEDARPTRLRRRAPKYLAAGAALAAVVIGGSVLAWLWLQAPAGRPGSASAVAVRTDQRPSLAVLPFANQTGEVGRNYLADGITDDLISALGRFTTLTVMSRNAVAPYKDQVPRAGDIGRELNVRYLILGSIREGGDRLRVTAQLTDATTGVVLWSGSFDDAGKDLLAAQDAIVRQVAGALAVNVTQFEARVSAAKPPEALQAYDLLLRARAQMAKATRSGHVEARRLLDRAIELDPRFAELFVAYSQIMYDRSQLGWAEAAANGFRDAEALAQHALTLEPNSAGARSQLASIHAVFMNYTEALAEAERAMALNPSDPAAQAARASVLLWLGRPEEAIAGITALQRTEPQLGSNSTFTLGCSYLLLGQYELARAVIESTLHRFPTYPFHYAVLAAALAELGRDADAAAAVREARRYDPFFNVELFGSRFRSPADRDKLVSSLRKAGLG